MDKKKVGIVTFHTADNYGAVLQAYALQEYIKNQFHYNVKIVDFCMQSHLDSYKIFSEKSNNIVKRILKNILIAFYYYPLKVRKNRFNLFRSKLLNLTSHRYAKPEDFLQKMEYFDYYIAGSDQVFNPKVAYSECYYLGFDKGKSKKIAYAPSFGIQTFTKEETDKIYQYCLDFDFLSCRESQGAEFLSNLFKKNIPTVCDPVFLLSKKEWSEIMVSPKVSQPYILVYDLNGGQKLIQLSNKIKEAYPNLQIICVTTKTRISYKGAKVLRNVGPCELLGLINGAEYVVTDSFHGSVLSVIFNKRIINYIATPQTSSRIKSVFSMLDIDNQLISDTESFSIQKISFRSYSGKLKSFIESSKSFLSECLEG